MAPFIPSELEGTHFDIIKIVYRQYLSTLNLVWRLLAIFGVHLIRFDWNRCLHHCWLFKPWKRKLSRSFCGYLADDWFFLLLSSLIHCIKMQNTRDMHILELSDKISFGAIKKKKNSNNIDVILHIGKSGEKNTHTHTDTWFEICCQIQRHHISCSHQTIVGALKKFVS